MRSILCVSVLLLPASAVAQRPAESGVSLRTSVREVVVDLVVRDKHGKVVKNLKPDDVAIYEDGVRQEVRSFRLVTGREIHEGDVRATAPGGPGKSSAPNSAIIPEYNPLRAVNMVCLVFQDVDPSSSKLAFDAAASFLKSELRPNTLIGVMTLDDRGVHPVYPFSSDRAELLKAIAHAAAGQIPAISTSQQLYTAMGLTWEVNFSGPALPPQAGGASAAQTTGSNVGSTPLMGPTGAEGETGLAAQIAANPLGRSEIRYERVVGMRELHALDWLVTQMSAVPFQKTVLLISPGINRPASELDYWNGIIHRANASGVTFYAFDVRGIVAADGTTPGPKTSLSGAVAAQRQTAALSQAQHAAVSQGGGAGQMMDRMQEGDILQYSLLTANTEANLGELAERTGGFLIHDTNNPAKQFTRVMEDVDTHYEVVYRPKSENYDGRFRGIEVRLDKDDWRAESRPGYYAVPDTPGGGALTQADLACLRALNTAPLPHTFDFRSRALQFRSNTGAPEFAIAFDIPMSHLTVTPGQEHQYQLHASLLALVKDAHGQIVDKIGSDAPMVISDKELATTQSGRIMYNHTVDLPPGHYTVETAVVDWESNRATTNVVQVDSLEPNGPEVSSIALVRRLDKVEGPADAANPFEFEGKRVSPALFTDLPSGAQPYVFFRVYPDKNNHAKPQMRVQCLLDGKLIANQTADLPAPYPSAGMPFGVGLASISGSYEVKIAVLQGSESAEQSILYTIAK